MATCNVGVHADIVPMVRRLEIVGNGLVDGVGFLGVDFVRINVIKVKAKALVHLRNVDGGRIRIRRIIIILVTVVVLLFVKVQCGAHVHKDRSGGSVELLPTHGRKVVDQVVHIHDIVLILLVVVKTNVGMSQRRQERFHEAGAAAFAAVGQTAACENAGCQSVRVQVQAIANGLVVIVVVIKVLTQVFGNGGEIKILEGSVILFEFVPKGLQSRVNGGRGETGVAPNVASDGPVVPGSVVVAELCGVL